MKWLPLERIGLNRKEKNKKIADAEDWLSRGSNKRQDREINFLEVGRGQVQFAKCPHVTNFPFFPVKIHFHIKSIDLKEHNDKFLLRSLVQENAVLEK